MSFRFFFFFFFFFLRLLLFPETSASLRIFVLAIISGKDNGNLAGVTPHFGSINDEAWKSVLSHRLDTI